MQDSHLDVEHNPEVVAMVRHGTPIEIHEVGLAVGQSASRTVQHQEEDRRQKLQVGVKLLHQKHVKGLLEDSMPALLEPREAVQQVRSHRAPGVM